MKMEDKKNSNGNIVDVAEGCIETMLKRGWVEVKPGTKTKQIAAEAKKDGKS